MQPLLPQTTWEKAKCWLAGSPWRAAMLVGLAVALVKFPLVFRWLGEDDQARLIFDAIVYRHDGTDTLRSYGVFTSPLWTLFFAALSRLFDAESLIVVSNIGGWLCGGIATGLSFALLRRLGATGRWAVCGALATALLPGTFYLSLYGYPSQYALPLLLFSMLGFSVSLDAVGHARRRWYAAAATTFVLLALTKVDFALAGTSILSIAIISRRVRDPRTAWLPVVAVVAAGVVYTVTRFAISGRDMLTFLSLFDQLHPWETDTATGASAVTVLYACGFGTLSLAAIAIVAGLRRREDRMLTTRIVVAWLVGVLPLWIFWLAHPPMSTRHAVPGAVLTALLATLLAAHLLKRVRLAAPLWLAALVALNWPFGEPNLDFNYLPSGNLSSTLVVNRRAFAVNERIARQVARRREPIKVVIGPRRRDILGGIDFVPSIEIVMAADCVNVKAIGDLGRNVVFVGKHGYRTRLFTNVPAPSAVTDFRIPGAGYYSPWGTGVGHLRANKMKVRGFNAEKLFLTIGSHDVQLFWDIFRRRGAPP